MMVMAMMMMMIITLMGASIPVYRISSKHRRQLLVNVHVFPLVFACTVQKYISSSVMMMTMMMITMMMMTTTMADDNDGGSTMRPRIRQKQAAKVICSNIVPIC